MKKYLVSGEESAYTSFQSVVFQTSKASSYYSLIDRKMPLIFILGSGEALLVCQDGPSWLGLDKIHIHCNVLGSYIAILVKTRPSK